MKLKNHPDLTFWKISGFFYRLNPLPTPIQPMNTKSALETTQKLHFLGRSYLMNWVLFFGFNIFLWAVYSAELKATIGPGKPDSQLSAGSGQMSQGFEDLFAEVAIVEVSSLQNQERDNITVNQAQTYQAFTICEPLFEAEGCQEKIFIEEMTTGKYYQIEGIPMSWRPFTNLIWTDEKILEFDRWSTPHYRLHYTVDMTEKKLVDVSEFEE